MIERPVLNTVFLIDDDSLDNRMHRRVIERAANIETIVEFTLAERALDHLRDPANIRPDLVLLDINMPRMDGFEFLECILAEFGEGLRAVVVVMLTTSLHPDDVERAKRYDIIQDYVSKPLTAEKFLEIVDKLRAQTAKVAEQPKDPNVAAGFRSPK